MWGHATLLIWWFINFKLTVHLKLYYIPEVIPVPDWLKAFLLTIVLLTSFITTTHMQWVVDVNDSYFWPEWFFWACSYEQRQPPGLVSEKYKAVHEFRILAKYLKSTCEDFKFWEVAGCRLLYLKKNLFRIVFQGFCLLFRNTCFKKHFWLATFIYSTPVWIAV